LQGEHWTARGGLDLDMAARVLCGDDPFEEAAMIDDMGEVELRGLEPLTFSLRRLRLVGGSVCFGPTLGALCAS
jgi:hypothetical protein